MLDRKRDFSYVTGMHGVAFEQDGKLFTPDGDEFDPNAGIREASRQASELTRTLHLPKK